MAKKLVVLTKEQSEQPFQTRDALAQYVLHAMEERAKASRKTGPGDAFVDALHLHLAEMEPGDRITV